MKPDLFRLIKHGSILTWKVVAIFGGAVATTWLQTETDEEPDTANETYPWDASRAADAKYLEDATAAGIAWNYYGSSKPDETDWDFTS